MLQSGSQPGGPLEQTRSAMQSEMVIKGLMVDPVTNMPIVILRDKEGERVLPIWVGIFEANAIALQIENIATPRPMTHDLLRNVIRDLNGAVEKIVVSDLKETTFYALIYLRVGAEVVAVDARPSDALALALRTQAPIFVEEHVIDSAKTVDLSPEPASADRLQKFLAHGGSLQKPGDLGEGLQVRAGRIFRRKEEEEQGNRLVIHCLEGNPASAPAEAGGEPSQITHLSVWNRHPLAHTGAAQPLTVKQNTHHPVPVQRGMEGDKRRAEFLQHLFLIRCLQVTDNSSRVQKV